MDLNGRLLTLEIDNFDLYEIFLHEILKKIKEGNNEKILKQVRHGIGLKFSFEDFIKSRFTRKVFVKVKNGKEVGGDIIKIKISGQDLLEKDFDDEILERVRLMRGWLWENMTIEKIGGWRESKEESGE